MPAKCRMGNQRRAFAPPEYLLWVDLAHIQVGPEQRHDQCAGGQPDERGGAQRPQTLECGPTALGGGHTGFQEHAGHGGNQRRQTEAQGQSGGRCGRRAGGQQQSDDGLVYQEERIRMPADPIPRLRQPAARVIQNGQHAIQQHEGAEPPAETGRWSCRPMSATRPCRRRTPVCPAPARGSCAGARTHPRSVASRPRGPCPARTPAGVVINTAPRCHGST